MGIAGQNTFTGINAQADLAMLFLLENYEKEDFKEILLEGDGWEDFTLIYDKKTISFEVKWHKKPLTYSDIKNIIEKEINKGAEQAFTFKIICKRVNDTFLKDLNYLKNTMPYWLNFHKNKDAKENEVVKKFLKKGWKDAELMFLLNTEIVEMGSEQNLANKLNDSFAIKDSLYYSPEDIRAVTSTIFKQIVVASTEGQKINKSDFSTFLKDLKKQLAHRSESFSPGKAIGDLDLKPYFENESNFLKLNRTQILSPLTYRPRTIHEIVERLIDLNFKLESYRFFIEKILIKQSYTLLCLKLLKIKREQGLLDGDFYISFLDKNFSRFTDDFSVHDSLKLLLDFLKNDPSQKLVANSLAFLQKHLLSPVGFAIRKRDNELDYSYKYVHLIEIVQIIGTNLPESNQFVELLFKYFDFTSNEFQLSTETPGPFFTWIKNYIKTNPSLHIKKIVGLYSKQHQKKYRFYNGSDVSGGVTKFFSDTYSLQEKGIVKLVFSRVFAELYEEDQKRGWDIIKKCVLVKSKKEFSRTNPVFLKRSIVPIVLRRFKDENLSKSEQKNAFNVLVSVLKIQKGLPSTSDTIFELLRHENLENFGLDNVFKLITVDSNKFKPGGIPTNVFALEVLIKVVSYNREKPRKYFLKLLENKELRRSHVFEEILNLLAANKKLLENEELSREIFTSIDFQSLILNKNDSCWIDNKFLLNLLKTSYSKDKGFFRNVLESLLDEETNPYLTDFFSSVLFQLLEFVDAISLYEILKKYTTDDLMKGRFLKARDFKYFCISLGEKLVKEGDIQGAKDFVLLFLEDLDPETSLEPSEVNYHLKIKTGASVRTIATVRGRLCWLIQKIVVTNELENMLFGLKHTQTLLDLDSKLAKKLGYPETDYYVTDQALVPLIELAQPKRRKIIQGDSSTDIVKELVWSVYLWVKKSFEEGSKPTTLLERIIHCFSNIRDLTEKEASDLLDFSEKHSLKDASGLFIFYAHFRNQIYPNLRFNQEPFKERIIGICKGTNPIKANIAWSLWRAEKEVPENKKFKIETLVYWMEYASRYDGSVFNYLSFSLQDRLNTDELFEPSLQLLKKALKSEIEHLSMNRSDYPRLRVDELLPNVFMKSISEYANVVNLMMELNDYEQGTSPFGGFFNLIYTLTEKISDESYSEVKKEIIDKLKKMDYEP